MCPNTVLITGGTGRVGSYAVKFLARSYGIEKIIFVGRNEDSGLTVKNNALISASLSGFYPSIEFKKINLKNIKQTSELIKKEKPDAIINTATAISLYPYFRKIKAKAKELCFIMNGDNSPCAHQVIKDLAILYPLIKSIKKSGVKTHIINVAGPDTNHYILSKVNNVPIIGAGTIDLTVHGIRLVMADRLGIPMRDINVQMVAHHALRHYPPYKSSKIKVPYFVRIFIEDVDVTEKINIDEFVVVGNEVSGVEPTTARNKTNAPMTAASAVKNTLAILNDTREIGHASGINGSPGGTPVLLTSDGAEMFLPKGITKEEALRINTEGMRLEGIERVKNDGTIVFTQIQTRWLEEALNLSWREVKLANIQERAQELSSSYQDL